MIISAIRLDLAAIYLVVTLIIALAVFILSRFVGRSIRSLSGRGGASCHGSSTGSCDSGSCAGCNRSSSCGIRQDAGNETRNKRRLP